MKLHVFAVAVSIFLQTAMSVNVITVTPNEKCDYYDTNGDYRVCGKDYLCMNNICVMFSERSEGQTCEYNASLSYCEYGTYCSTRSDSCIRPVNPIFEILWIIALVFIVLVSFLFLREFCQTSDYFADEVYFEEYLDQAVGIDKEVTDGRAMKRRRRRRRKSRSKRFIIF